MGLIYAVAAAPLFRAAESPSIAAGNRAEREPLLSPFTGYNLPMKIWRTLPSYILAACVLAVSLAIAAQEPDHHPGPAMPSVQLKVVGLDRRSISFTPEEFAALPHKDVTVLNQHSQVTEKYSGVPLAYLLSKVGMPMGDKIRGKLLLTGVIAEGTDAYRVLFALGEIDPATHVGDIIVADAVNEHKLDRDGAFKIVSTEEKRPARWVRNLTSVTVVEINP
jgi:hypothetical protein